MDTTEIASRIDWSSASVTGNGTAFLRDISLSARDWGIGGEHHRMARTINSIIINGRNGACPSEIVADRVRAVFDQFCGGMSHAQRERLTAVLNAVYPESSTPASATLMVSADEASTLYAALNALSADDDPGCCRESLIARMEALAPLMAPSGIVPGAQHSR